MARHRNAKTGKFERRTGTPAAANTPMEASPIPPGGTHPATATPRTSRSATTSGSTSRQRAKSSPPVATGRGRSRRSAAARPGPAQLSTPATGRRRSAAAERSAFIKMRGRTCWPTEERDPEGEFRTLVALTSPGLKSVILTDITSDKWVGSLCQKKANVSTKQLVKNSKLDAATHECIIQKVGKPEVLKQDGIGSGALGASFSALFDEDVLNKVPDEAKGAALVKLASSVMGSLDGKQCADLLLSLLSRMGVGEDGTPDTFVDVEDDDVLQKKRDDQRAFLQALGLHGLELLKAALYDDGIVTPFHVEDWSAGKYVPVPTVEVVVTCKYPDLGLDEAAWTHHRFIKEFIKKNGSKTMQFALEYFYTEDGIFDENHTNAIEWAQKDADKLADSEALWKSLVKAHQGLHYDVREWKAVLDHCWKFLGLMNNEGKKAFNWDQQLQCWAAMQGFCNDFGKIKNFVVNVLKAPPKDVEEYEAIQLAHYNGAWEVAKKRYI